MIEKLYTVEEVAELASVTGRTIRNYLKSGRLVGRKIGGQWRFPEAEVQRLLTGGLPPEEPEDTAQEPAPQQESVPAAPALRVAPEPEPAFSEEEYEEACETQPEPPRYPLAQAVPPQQAAPRQATSYNEPAPLPGAVRPPVKPAPVPEPRYQPEIQPALAPQPAGQPAPLPRQAPATQPEYGAAFPLYQQPAPPSYQAPAYGTQPQQPAYSAPSQGSSAPGTAQSQPLYPAQDPALYRQSGYPGPSQQPRFVTSGGVLYEAVPVGGYSQQSPPAQAPAAPAAYPPPPGNQPASEAPATPSPQERADKHEAEPPLDPSVFPHLSDVGNRVTKFISEVHDYSKGPQMCAVVDLHQSFSAARITSQRLADIADEESESGLLCQSFVEFDERFYVARYTLFGTTAFLLRCLKLIG